MKFEKISAGHYRAENGFRIKKVKPSYNININQIWFIYDAEGHKIEHVAFTMEEAKNIVKILSQEEQNG